MGACETTAGPDWQGCWELPTGQRLMPRPKARSWAKGLGGVQGQWVVIARTRRCASMSSQLLESVRALVGQFGEACRLPRSVTFDGVPQQRSHQAACGFPFRQNGGYAAYDAQSWLFEVRPSSMCSRAPFGRYHSQRTERRAWRPWDNGSGC